MNTQSFSHDYPPEEPQGQKAGAVLSMPLPDPAWVSSRRPFKRCWLKNVPSIIITLHAGWKPWQGLIIKTCFKSAVDFPAVLSWWLSSALLQRHTLQLELHSSFCSYSYCRQSSPYRYIADCHLPGMQSSVQLEESQNCIYSKWIPKESCPIWHYCSITVLPQVTNT